MESIPKYNLVGGITSVVLHPTTTLSSEGVASGDGYNVTLCDWGSSYVETLNVQDGLYMVTHKLTFVGYVGEDPIAGERFKAVLREGVVADVVLNSGVTIRVGWSDKYGSAAPLRLVSSELESGEKPIDYPLKKWIWESVDTISLI